MVLIFNNTTYITLKCICKTIKGKTITLLCSAFGTNKSQFKMVSMVKLHFIAECVFPHYKAEHRVNFVFYSIKVNLIYCQGM